MIRCFTFLLLLLIIAVPIPAAAAEQADWYDIEIIVFKYKTPDSDEAVDSTNQDADAPDLEQAIELVPPDSASSRPVPVTSPLAIGRIPYQRLEESEYRMNPLASRLESSGEYEPLLHVAWQQPVQATQPRREVRLHSILADEASDLKLPPTRLPFATGLSGSADVLNEAAVEGTAGIERGRFLHFHLDLRYMEPADNDTGLFSIFSREEPRPKVYRLEDQRRIDVDEVHYFDHPAFGVLVLVTPNEVPEEAADPPRDS